MLLGVLASLVAMGCHHEGANSKLISLGGPPTVSLEAVAPYLTAELIEAQQVEPAVAGHDAAEPSVVGRLHQLVHQLGAGDRADVHEGDGGHDPRVPGPDELCQLLLVDAAPSSCTDPAP